MFSKTSTQEYIRAILTLLKVEAPGYEHGRESCSSSSVKSTLSIAMSITSGGDCQAYGLPRFEGCYFDDFVGLVLRVLRIT